MELLSPQLSVPHARQHIQKRKPSTPIEIPKPRMAGSTPLFSPIRRPMSPELIFDMSPIESSISEHYYQSLMTPEHTNEYFPFPGDAAWSAAMHSPPSSYGRFMYPFPRITPRPVDTKQIATHLNVPTLHPAEFPKSPPVNDNICIRPLVRHEASTPSFWKEEELPVTSAHLPTPETPSVAKAEPAVSLAGPVVPKLSGLKVQSSGCPRLLSPPPSPLRAAYTTFEVQCKIFIDKEHGKWEVGKHRMHQAQVDKKAVRVSRA